jgi:putative N6-adenine-specific DNA methylase
MAPGLKRSFVSETWWQIPEHIWRSVKDEAREQIKEVSFQVLASDIDTLVLRKARENAERAGVSDLIAFQKLSVDQFRSRKKYGYIICNPPYGERLNEENEVKQLYKTMGETFSQLDTWSFFILTAYSGFERSFGKKATKNRKLYNGMLQCYLHEYFGPKPKKDSE